VQSPVVRLLPLALLSAGLAACGGSTPKHESKFGIYVENLPKHRSFRLNWTENARDLGGNKLMTFHVKTLEVGPNGWSAQVSFRNVSTRTIVLPKGGPSSPKSWGLGVFTNAASQRVEDQGNYEIKTKTIAPPLPAELKPGQSWSGAFGASEPPRARRWLHLVFGVFFWKGKPPPGLGAYFLWITTHQLRAPPPQGVTPAMSTSP
jgi:hypothetical protein